MTEDEVLARKGVARGAKNEGGASRSPSTWKRRLVLVAGPLALAAAMVVYVTGQRGPTIADLPAYTVTATGDPAAPDGGEAQARLRLPKAGARRGARFELLLRPAGVPEGKVVAYGFTFEAPGSEAVPLDAKVELGPEGAIRLTGAPHALAGAREIRIVVGEPAAIGKFDDAAARAAADKTDTKVRVLTVPIDRE
jgi:hypothetical protein